MDLKKGVKWSGRMWALKRELYAWSRGHPVWNSFCTFHLLGFSRSHCVWLIAAIKTKNNLQVLFFTDQDSCCAQAQFLHPSSRFFIYLPFSPFLHGFVFPLGAVFSFAVVALWWRARAKTVEWEWRQFTAKKKRNLTRSRDFNASKNSSLTLFMFSPLEPSSHCCFLSLSGFIRLLIIVIKEKANRLHPRARIHSWGRRGGENIQFVQIRETQVAEFQNCLCFALESFSYRSLTLWMEIIVNRWTLHVSAIHVHPLHLLDELFMENKFTH